MYWEDVDFSVRAHRSGALLSLLTEVTVTHDSGGTQRSTSQPLSKSPLYMRYNCRNRLVMAAKLIDPAWHRSWLIRTPSYAREVALRSGRRALLRRPSLVLAAFVGTLEGLIYWIRLALHRHRHPVRQPDSDLGVDR
jgi:GT2 family glycosyltransferase